jgi:hypothetical protein
MNLLKTLQEEAHCAEAAQPSSAYDVWARPRSLFTEDEALSWMGTRLHRGAAIGEVKATNMSASGKKKDSHITDTSCTCVGMMGRWNGSRRPTPQGWRPHWRP